MSRSASLRQGQGGLRVALFLLVSVLGLDVAVRYPGDMNALDLLQAITYSDKVQAIVSRGADTLVLQWRRDVPGKTDDEILRTKLAENGWKYSRQKGRWRHPKGDGVAPRLLIDLAQLTSRAVLEDVLNKE